MLTVKQRELARHALGLPNRTRKSYRNRFVCEENEPNWCQMVEAGLATVRGADTLPFGGSACFYLTLKGALAALEPNEKLCREDFPRSVSYPVLFSAPMVRAIWEGRKTQTRRLFKGDIAPYGFGAFICDDNVYADDENGWGTLVRKHAPVKVGNLLWVREAWASDVRNDGIKPSLISQNEPAWFAADGRSVNTTSLSMRSSKTRPSIFMPRWLSRMTLEVAGVRIERLQDISEQDAVAEGVEKDSDGWRDYVKPHTQCCSSARDSFRTLWDSLNADRGSWDANPWVTAITFTVHKTNIDEVTT